MKMIMNFRVPQNVGNSLTNRANVAWVRTCSMWPAVHCWF